MMMPDENAQLITQDIVYARCARKDVDPLRSVYATHLLRVVDMTVARCL